MVRVLVFLLGLGLIFVLVFRTLRGRRAGNVRVEWGGGLPFCYEFAELEL